MSRPAPKESIHINFPDPTGPWCCYRAGPFQGHGSAVPGTQRIHPYLAIHQNVEPDPKHLVECPLFHPIFSVVFGISVQLVSVNGLPGEPNSPCNPTALGSWTKIWECAITDLLLTFSLKPLKELGYWNLSSLCLSFPAYRMEFQLLLLDLMSPGFMCSRYW